MKSLRVSFTTSSFISLKRLISSKRVAFLHHYPLTGSKVMFLKIAKRCDFKMHSTELWLVLVWLHFFPLIVLASPQITSKPQNDTPRCTELQRIRSVYAHIHLSFSPLSTPSTKHAAFSVLHCLNTLQRRVVAWISLPLSFGLAQPSNFFFN